MRAWLVQRDGSMEPVEVLRRGLWPGIIRIERDGRESIASINELVAENGRPLRLEEVAR